MVDGTIQLVRFLVNIAYHQISIFWMESSETEGLNTIANKCTPLIAEVCCKF